MNILREFRTFPVTEGNEIRHSFQITTQQESSPKTQILGTAKLFVTSDQRIPKTQPRKT